MEVEMADTETLPRRTKGQQKTGASGGALCIASLEELPEHTHDYFLQSIEAMQERLAQPEMQEWLAAQLDADGNLPPEVQAALMDEALATLPPQQRQALEEWLQTELTADGVEAQRAQKAAEGSLNADQISEAVEMLRHSHAHSPYELSDEAEREAMLEALQLVALANVQLTSTIAQQTARDMAVTQQQARQAQPQAPGEYVHDASYQGRLEQERALGQQQPGLGV
jgi:hypothetical protein